jgi:hypothetical protein
MEGENTPDRGFFLGMPVGPARPLTGISFPFIQFMANLMLIFIAGDNIPL